jgi:hypothetical protein
MVESSFQPPKLNMVVEGEDVATTMKKHREMREKLMKQEAALHFSYDLEAGLTQKERQANEKLTKLKEQLCNPNFNVVIRDFFEHKKMVEDSKLFEVLNMMPKGGIHHIHTTAAPPVGTYMQLTYDPIVYYNDREKMFKVFPKHKKLDGYLQCTKMREFSKDKKAYDESLKNAILLTEEQIKGKESHDIWKGF